MINDDLKLTGALTIAVNDEIVQEMWAGLFASSCDKDGQDD